MMGKGGLKIMRMGEDVRWQGRGLYRKGRVLAIRQVYLPFDAMCRKV